MALAATSPPHPVPSESHTRAPRPSTPVATRTARPAPMPTGSRSPEDDPSTTGLVGHLRDCGCGRLRSSLGSTGTNFATREGSSCTSKSRRSSGDPTRAARSRDRRPRTLRRPYADRIWYVGNKAERRHLLSTSACRPPTRRPGVMRTDLQSRALGQDELSPTSAQPDPAAGRLTIVCTGNGGNATCSPATSAIAPAVFVYAAVFEVSDNTDPSSGRSRAHLAVDGTLSGS